MLEAYDLYLIYAEIWPYNIRVVGWVKYYFRFTYARDSIHLHTPSLRCDHYKFSLFRRRFGAIECHFTLIFSQNDARFIVIDQQQRIFVANFVG